MTHNNSLPSGKGWGWDERALQLMNKATHNKNHKIVELRLDTNLVFKIPNRIF